MIRLTGKLHVLDSWDLIQNERIHILVDGEFAYTRQFYHTGNPSINSVCGDPKNVLNYGDELNVGFFVEIPHQGKEFTVIIMGELNGDTTDESWGISDLQIQVYSDERDTENRITLNKLKPVWESLHFT